MKKKSHFFSKRGKKYPHFWLHTAYNIMLMCFKKLGGQQEAEI